MTSSATASNAGRPREAIVTTGQRETGPFRSVESHTEGMPTRVILDGVGVVPGETMAAKREWFIAHRDHLRQLLMFEPRGHSAMSGAILQPPTRDDCDWGVLFIEVSGLLPMCGHGTIGVATVLVEEKLVDVQEGETVIRLDTPAGPVIATVAVKDGHAESVTIRNVPSFSLALDQKVTVPGLGQVTYDMAFGGNFYAIVELDAIGVAYDREHPGRMLETGLTIMAAINEQNEPVHPERPDIRGCHHVYLAAPGSTAEYSRHAMAIHPGWFDRSPCGTGTSARMAQLHARGELAMDSPFLNESVIGSQFTGRLVEQTEVAGRPAVIPEITGRAWVTGRSEFVLDPRDPFPVGFLL